MKILIAEDDPFTREGLIEIFRMEGYTVIAAEDGIQALEYFRTEKPDFLCLDIMMPGKNGYDVCKTVRKEDQRIPVLFLSAKSEEIDKVLGLELGADDYISKPFGVKEIVARVRAILRRSTPETQEEPKESFLLADLIVIPAELIARRKNNEIELSLRDIKILLLFSRNQGAVLSRDAIYNAAWGVEHLPNSRTLDQHISQLRKKIEVDPKNPRIIQTVHNAGYRYPK